MGIKINNNAVSLLAMGITASDTTVSVASGTGALFPTLSVDEYFYAAIEDTSNNFEIVKVTARTSDAMTVVRAQEGTTALAFPAGAAFDLRMTAQTFYDYIAATVGTATVDTFSGTGTTAPYTLSVAPTAIQQLIVTVSGVVQAPTTDYTISGTSLTPVVAWPSGAKILAFQHSSSSVLTGVLRTTDLGATVQAYDVATAKTNQLQTFTKSQRGTVTAANTASYDMSLTNNFTTTLSTSQTISFTNITAGQSGNIIWTVTGTPTIAKNSYVKCSSSMLATLGTAGSYWVSYYSPDGTNVYMAVTGALA